MPNDSPTPAAINAFEVAVRSKPSIYPEPFASMMNGRSKRVLGELFGLRNFGVNLVTLAPGAVSSIRHAHSLQDEFVYILRGAPTLHTDEGYTDMQSGMCAGFKAGTGNGHRLLNNSDEDVVYLEIGDRTPGDEGTYPDDDLKALRVDNSWVFIHKDGTPY
ncbi:MAG: cupin domain-containing protein [Gammaproteobacteria bacterium]|nr:cupin domain-containing protein [Gammaproteobacteria bacterium]